jgi:hypothetical protein
LRNFLLYTTKIMFFDHTTISQPKAPQAPGRVLCTLIRFCYCVNLSLFECKKYYNICTFFLRIWKCLNVAGADEIIIYIYYYCNIFFPSSLFLLFA